MANVTVHSSSTHIDIHFNDLSSLSGAKDDILPKLEVLPSDLRINKYAGFVINYAL